MRFIDQTLCHAVLAAGLLVATASIAADSRSEADKLYKSDRAACMRGDTGQDRATCLKEAGAARAEARRGRLGDGEGAFERNRMVRCDPLPESDRQDCIRRMNGEGTVSGSVEGGGIYRELRTTVPAQ